MVTAYYSAVLDYPLESVWSLIRDFNNYPSYIEGVTESVIEDDRRGDEVGAIRRFRYGDASIRQRLADHSDEHHSLTYAGMDPFPFPAGLKSDPPPPATYEGTMHLLEIVDGGRTFIEWSITVDCGPDHAESWRSLLLSLIEVWTGSLDGTLARSAPAHLVMARAS